ncbi:MAG TPA: hypothetical protein VF014_12260 [Casimicrobiaceae bacterium]|nr:hypothetical protein [Casimicrobiaceae bacterium]
MRQQYSATAILLDAPIACAALLPQTVRLPWTGWQLARRTAPRQALSRSSNVWDKHFIEKLIAHGTAGVKWWRKPVTLAGRSTA